MANHTLSLYSFAALVALERSFVSEVRGVAKAVNCSGAVLTNKFEEEACVEER